MSSPREEIERFAEEYGALLGFAPVARWDEYGDVPIPFRPGALWKEAETVIVLGLPVLLPMLETTPSIIYTTLYETCNTELDQLGFRLCRILNRQGYASIFMPRDGYGHITVLVDEPTASFSQVYAAKYAGLGTVGYNHTLLTAEYGPRVRFVSVFTTLQTPASSMVAEELCIRCLMCGQCCPTQAFEDDDGKVVARMNKWACAKYHAELREAYRFPCGVCIKVCPVGEDRQLYKSQNTAKYVSENAANDEQQAWRHFQKYGSKPLKEREVHT